MDLKDFFVDPDIRKAQSLPVEAFTSKKFLRREMETVFRNSWLMVPEYAGPEVAGKTLAEHVRLRGAQAPFTLLDTSLFLQRDSQGTLRCFPNACTHAWYPLVHAPMRPREKMIVCGQHGRQFELDGTFRGHANFPKCDSFPRDCDSLRSIPTDVWRQFLFVLLGCTGDTFVNTFPEMIADTARLHIERWKPVSRIEGVRTVPGNWKQHAWNYLDKFHIPFVHRSPHGLADAIVPDSYRTELYGSSVLQWVYAQDPASGFDPTLLPERFRDPDHPDRRVFALWWFLFPNITLNFYPWGLSVNIYSPIAKAPKRTRFIWQHFVADETLYAARDTRWLSSDVDDEDVDAIGRVLQGMNSFEPPRGTFAPEDETGPHWFHYKVSKMVAE